MAAMMNTEVKLFVGNIPFECDVQRLQDIFGQYATITDLFIPHYQDSGRPRGFAMISVTDIDSANLCIENLNNTELDGRTIRVNIAMPKRAQQVGGVGGVGGGDWGGNGMGAGGFNQNGGGMAAPNADVKLFVGNLSFNTTTETIQEYFQQFGTVTDCFLPKDRQTGRPRGFAFVTMPAEEAKVACDTANGVEIEGRVLRVNVAQPKGPWGGGGGGGGGGGYGGGYGRGYGGGGGGGGYAQQQGGFPAGGYVGGPIGMQGGDVINQF
ncbi:hypothetical protein TrVE_jg9116 [Triparma verrucosa]|uniref:RRM domain-containing protein n=1 Tax=Triparma verrucosa TaxID=1606542 RepID=A0A9W7B8W0_9STRA|nr:hypothetical protein TrVE_jg9116 [Triparma verrucosa]